MLTCQRCFRQSLHVGYGLLASQIGKYCCFNRLAGYKFLRKSCHDLSPAMFALPNVNFISLLFDGFDLYVESNLSIHVVHGLNKVTSAIELLVGLQLLAQRFVTLPIVLLACCAAVPSRFARFVCHDNV